MGLKAQLLFCKGLDEPGQTHSQQQQTTEHMGLSGGVDSELLTRWAQRPPSGCLVRLLVQGSWALKESKAYNI